MNLSFPAQAKPRVVDGRDRALDAVAGDEPDLDDDLRPSVAVAYDARRCREGVAFEPHASRHGALTPGAFAVAVPDALESLAAAGGVGLVVALFDHLVAVGPEGGGDGGDGAAAPARGESLVALLLTTLAAAIRGSALHAAELLRLGGLRFVERALARCADGAVAEADGDAARVVGAVVALRGAAAACAPLEAQIFARLQFHTALFVGRLRAHAPRRLRDALVDAMVAATRRAAKG